MKPELGDKQRLLHILEAIGNIESFLSGFDQAGFQNSKLHVSAIE